MRSKMITIFLGICVFCILIGQTTSHNLASAEVATCDECDGRFVNVTGDRIKYLTVRRNLRVNRNLRVRRNLYVDDNVGIGTTSPVDKLEIEGGALAIDEADGLGAIRFRQNDSMKWTFLTASWIGDDFRLRNEMTGIDVMTFDSGTNRVGIGTTSPNYKLDVQGYVQASGYYTGDIVFQKDGEKLWRMFERKDGLYLENLKTGKVSKVFLEEDLVSLKGEIEELQKRIARLEKQN